MQTHGIVLAIGGVFACGPSVHSIETPDEVVGNLDGNRYLSSSEASALLEDHCPPDTTAHGWYEAGNLPSRRAWCEDAHGLLQGPTVIRTGSSTSVGHFRDGIADGVFSGPEGRAVYAHGLLDGPCTFAPDVSTFRQGKLDGPFTWSFGDRCDESEIGGDTGYPDITDCLEGDRGYVSGTFADGVARDNLVVDNHGHTREVALQPGVKVVIPELGTDPRLAGLLAPEHRWTGGLACGYQNDTIVRRGPWR